MIVDTTRPRPPVPGGVRSERCQRIDGVVARRYVPQGRAGGQPSFMIDADTDTVWVVGRAPGSGAVEVGDHVVVIASRSSTGIYRPYSIDVV